MSNSSLAKLLIYAALPFVAVSLLQKPLGLNEWAQPILGLIAVLLLWTGIWLQRRAKAAGELTPSSPSAPHRRNRLFLLAAILVGDDTYRSFLAPIPRTGASDASACHCLSHFLRRFTRRPIPFGAEMAQGLTMRFSQPPPGLRLRFAWLQPLHCDPGAFLGGGR